MISLIILFFEVWVNYERPKSNSQILCYISEQGDQGGPVVAGHPSSPVLVGIISGNQHNCVEIYK